MKKQWWHRPLLALCLAAALALSGCGEVPPVVDDLSKPADTEPEPTETRVILPESFALPYNPAQTLDPITCPDGMQQTVGALLYEGLFQLDETLTPQPRLCTTYTVGEGGAHTFTLRPGVLFSDGTPLTAKDVALTLHRAMTSARYGARLSGVTAVTAGEGTVTVTLSAPNAGLPALLDIPIVKAGTETGRAPVGTGAYHYAAEEGAPALLANPHWWGSARPVARIGLSAADGRDAMLYQFTSHDVQLITGDLTGTAPISASGNVTFQDANTTVLQYVGFNLQRPLLGSAAVRQALGKGINRSRLVSAFLSGHGRAAQFPVSPASPLYPTALEEVYSYDAFVSAMETAGLATGTPRTLTLLVNAENSFKVAVADSLAQALTAFDLRVEVQALPFAEFTAALDAGAYDLYYGEVKLTADWDLRPLLGTGGALNKGGWSNTQTDLLLAAYGAEGGAAAMERLCTQLQSQAPILPVCFKSTTVLLQSGVAEGLAPTVSDPFYNLENWTIHLKDPA